MGILDTIWHPSTVNELIAGSFGMLLEKLKLVRGTINGHVLSSGGAAQVLVGQPLDTVKTRAQIAPSN